MAGQLGRSAVRCRQDGSRTGTDRGSVAEEGGAHVRVVVRILVRVLGPGPETIEPLIPTALQGSIIVRVRGAFLPCIWCTKLSHLQCLKAS